MPDTVLIQSLGIWKKKACLKPDAVLILPLVKLIKFR